MLQRVAACCSLSQRVVVYCSVVAAFLQSLLENTRNSKNAHYRNGTCRGVCYSVLQCIAPPLLLFHTVIYYITVQTCDLTSAL